MITSTLRIVSAAFAFVLAGVPVASLAMQQSPAAFYDTRLVQEYGSPAPYSGTLQLRISPDNIVNGYYRPDAGLGRFVPVTGGRDGDNIWFDIGESGNLHVTGKFVKGSIVGTAVDHNVEYYFNADTAASPAK
jgi:hypothetical protein